MVSISTNTDVMWDELINSYNIFRNTLEGEINGTLLLNAMLTNMTESMGFEHELMLADTDARSRSKDIYHNLLWEHAGDIGDITQHYHDVLDDYLSEHGLEDEKKDFLPILADVIEGNYSSYVFRSSYANPMIIDRILNKVRELHEADKQMAKLLGKNVGGLASQYLR